MDVFKEKVYPELVQAEGWYANISSDRGGETYGGIARNFHPHWKGWMFIDEWKEVNGPIARNKRLPIQALDDLHYAYTKESFWDRYHLDGVQDDCVAHLVYDMLFQHGRGGQLIQQAILDVGGSVKADGVVGPKTVAAINEVNATALFDQLKERRRQYFMHLVNCDPEHSKPHLAGWLNRLNSFQKKTS